MKTQEQRKKPLPPIPGCFDDVRGFCVGRWAFGLWDDPGYDLEDLSLFFDYGDSEKGLHEYNDIRGGISSKELKQWASELLQLAEIVEKAGY